MMPVWFQRMSRRERVLSLIVAGTFFLLINLFLWSTLLDMAKRAQADLKSRKAQRNQQVVFLRERKTWEKRDERLQKHQPIMKGPGDASTLLEEVKQTAAKHNVLIENPAIGSSESNPNYQTASVSIETKSPWPPLVRFLYDAQKPEHFVVFESVNLAIDSQDATMMRGRFKIARWFQPKT
ncbi:MAG TPA: hypothetical protein VG095_04615 [Chthoniobacterales bacterium]|nr:hypothetical protein [Chthoniobacterales bacterium]